MTNSNEYYVWFSGKEYLSFHIDDVDEEMIDSDELRGPFTEENAVKMAAGLNEVAKEMGLLQPVETQEENVEEEADDLEDDEEDEDEDEEEKETDVTETEMPRMTTSAVDPKIQKKLNPPLHYKKEDMPEEILKIIEDAKLMPYVYRDPKGRWFAGYSYFQVQMIRGITNLQYVRKRAAEDDGPQIIRSIPLQPGSDTQIVILDIYSSHTFVYKKYDGDPDTRTYELKADGTDWPKIRKLLDELQVKWTDVTEKRREYHRKARSNQKSKAKGNSKRNRSGRLGSTDFGVK